MLCGPAVRVAIAALCGGTLLSVAPVAAAPPTPARQIADVVPGTLLIGVDEQASDDHVRSLATDVGGSLERSHGLSRSHVLRVPAGSEAAAAQALRGRPHVKYVEPNYIRDLHQAPPNDPLYASNQWNLTNIRAAVGWDAYPNCFQSCGGARANGPLVAVVDTGVDLNHTDLFDRSGGAQDVRGHGTHVAGIIAAAANNTVGVAGLAYNSRIASYRACDQYGDCAYGDIVNSI